MARVAAAAEAVIEQNEKERMEKEKKRWQQVQVDKGAKQQQKSIPITRTADRTSAAADHHHEGQMLGSKEGEVA